tara:strand:+ start:255363 stop:256034 length:672 start_codon:yes stop_codon:yes gene_type:complete
MTTKFVSLVAVVVFSFSAFAQKAREHSTETKTKIESISKLKGKEANEKIIKDLLTTVSEGKSKPEKLEAGLNELFKEDIVEKVKFGANLRTLLESPDQATRNSGKHMKGLLERLSDMKDADVQDVVKRLLKNSDISMSEVASTYEAQLAATNLLTYKKYVKGETSIDANTIELVGIANVMKSELAGVKGEGKSDVITSLKDLTAEQRKAVETKRDEWKSKCNS